MDSEHLEHLQKVLEVQAAIEDIHPFLAKLYPIVVVEDGHFLIYDTEPDSRQYRFVQRSPTPMPIPPGVRAAFQMPGYGDRMACVVTPDVFDEPDGYVTIFHEFVHCQQSERCEQQLKGTLAIARRAQAANDAMWEITHPFPYTARDFAQPYAAFLAGDDLHAAEAARAQLWAVLAVEDYEYMVWEEWKEGFARFIENRIRRRLGRDENHGGKAPPLDRVVFYEGGAHYIQMLGRQDPELVTDIERLFARMLEGGQSGLA